MDKKLDKLFTVGEFAARAGITVRTLRYYDTIGLLMPSTYNSSGHRLYNRHDFARLQKIMTLKFIGLSLNDIQNIIKQDSENHDFKKSLEIQKKVMETKAQHISMVISAIEEALHMVDSKDTLDWNKFTNIINVINTGENWLEQYENASNLRARIRIHEIFSTNKHGWMNWFFEHLEVPGSARILEFGCGDGSLWAANIHRIPGDWDITLTDFSPGMLKDAKNSLRHNARRFKFKVADVQSIPFDDSSFDVVLANHMLYHVADIERAFSEMARVLKTGGHFYASTVGKKHMVEMRDIIEQVGPGVIASKSWDITEKFQLENGRDIVSRWFKNVELKRYTDSLFVTGAAPLVDYILSMPDNSRDIVTDEHINGLNSFLENEILKTGGIVITKDTGFFHGRKRQ